MWRAFPEHLLCAEGAAVTEAKTPPVLGARSGAAAGFDRLTLRNGGARLRWFLRVAAVTLTALALFRHFQMPARMLLRDGDWLCRLPPVPPPTVAVTPRPPTSSRPAWWHSLWKALEVPSSPPPAPLPKPTSSSPD